MMCNNLYKYYGFSLIEMMIVVSMVAILTTVAYPTYRQYVIRSNRVAVEIFMMNATSKEEQLMLETHLYYSASGCNATAWNSILAVPSDIAANYCLSVLADNTSTPPTYQHDQPQALLHRRVDRVLHLRCQ